MTTRSWTLVMVPLFSFSDPLSGKLTIFKIIDFYHQLIRPNLLYIGNHKDLVTKLPSFRNFREPMGLFLIAFVEANQIKSNRKQKY